MTQETVFEIGQRVNVWSEEEQFICVGAIDGIHHPEEPACGAQASSKSANWSGRPAAARRCPGCA